MKNQRPLTLASGLCISAEVSLRRVQQHAFGFLFSHRAVEETFSVEVDLDESWPRGDGALDKRFRERVLDVLLQSAPQRTCAVAAIGQSFVKDPLFGVVGHRNRD